MIVACSITSKACPSCCWWRVDKQCTYVPITSSANSSLCLSVCPPRLSQVEARSDRTGEVIFKDTLESAVAGIVQVRCEWFVCVYVCVCTPVYTMRDNLFHTLLAAHCRLTTEWLGMKSWYVALSKEKVCIAHYHASIHAYTACVCTRMYVLWT